MKIRSLLLGSVAAVGLSTGAFATDLGVETSLDVCDELGLSGLTISSDTNCLQITGEVKYTFSWGDYEPALTLLSSFNQTSGNYDIIDDDGALDSDSTVDYWLQFVATASSSFGPATATLKLEDAVISGVQSLKVSQAWVGVGDTTMLMAGLKDSIYNSGDDEPLNFLGLFGSESVDSGVTTSSAVATGGHVIQLVSDLGNGLSIGGGLEDLNGAGSAVGVLTYADDNVSAHISVAAGDILNGGAITWSTHTGITGTWDALKFVGALAADSTGEWNGLGSLSYTMEGFTLAVSGEANNNNEWGIGGSIGTEVSDGVSLNLGARFYNDNDPNETLTQVAAQIVASVTDEVTLTGEVGAIATGSNNSFPSATIFYGKGELAWAPGGGFTSSVSGEVNSEGGVKATFKAAKTIE